MMTLYYHLDTYHYERAVRKLASWWSVGYSVLAPSDVVALACPAAL